jgi:cytochrome c oxidase subunit 2
MGIMPPEQKLWWKEPVEKTEVLWVTIALVWALIMFFMMPYWHFAGKQNLSNEAYRIHPEDFLKKTEDFAAKYKVREEGKTGVPVVKPPAGSDIYLVARRWEWWPVYELEKGKTYRLHISSMDLLHGFSLQPENINIQVHPGYDLVTTITPTSTGEFGIVCNEFCEVGHHTMLGKMYVK